MATRGRLGANAARLTSNEDFLRSLSLLDKAGDGIYVLDRESGRILHANEIAAQMLGYSREELLHLSATDIEATLSPAAIHAIHRRAEREVVPVEGLHRRKDGSTVPVEIRLTSLAPQWPDLLLAIVRDITDRKRLEEDRERDEQRKDEFLALLGHELRNPLAAITFANHLLSVKVSDEERASVEETISRQVNLLRRLVDDLLDLARITHGQIILQKDRIDLDEFVQRVAATAMSFFTEREQELVVRSPSGLAFLADRMRMEQIAGNLLNNASKYTGRGGRIEFSGAREGSDIVIRCKDNGQGILPDDQANIFGAFTRGQRANSYGEASLGIGLTLVKQLTELHGGTISVSSGGPDLGSEFVVRLPLIESPPVPRAQGKKLSISPTRHPVSILIVEDNPDVAGTMAAAMEQVGHKVTLFADGPSALSDVAGLKPDVALIDIGLPGMDGYELAAKLKKRRNLRHTLFIAISGMKKRIESWKETGSFDYYLVKPVNFAQLLALIDHSNRQGATVALRGTRKAENPQERFTARKLRRGR